MKIRTPHHRVVEILTQTMWDQLKDCWDYPEDAHEVIDCVRWIYINAGESVPSYVEETRKDIIEYNKRN